MAIYISNHTVDNFFYRTCYFILKIFKLYFLQAWSEILNAAKI